MIDMSKIYELARNAKWYHTIKLTPDIETNGTYNHFQYLSHYRFPDSLAGLTVLDVGAGDGFFSFEFEKRGAKEILAIDTNRCDGSIAIDPSPSLKANYIKKYDGIYSFNVKFKDIYREMGLENPNMFLVAHYILQSKVKYEQKSVYDIEENRKFDFVFCGDLIEHLKNPLAAVEKLFRLTSGKCIVSLSSIPDGIDSKDLVKYRGNVSGGSFFNFYTGTFREVLLASGFKTVDVVSEFNLSSKKSSKNKHAIFHCLP